MQKSILMMIVFINMNSAFAEIKSNFYIKPKTGQYIVVSSVKTQKQSTPIMKICLTEHLKEKLNIENEIAKKTCIENKVVDTPKYLKVEVKCDKYSKSVLEYKYNSENKYTVVTSSKSYLNTYVFTYSGPKCDSDAVKQYL